MRMTSIYIFSKNPNASLYEYKILYDISLFLSLNMVSFSNKMPKFSKQLKKGRFLISL